jgi:hypothetical protein
MVNGDRAAEKYDGIDGDLSSVTNGHSNGNYTLTCVQSLKYVLFVACFVK